jgi:hypothetical protein
MPNPPEVPGKETNAVLTIYIVPNKNSHECFADCVKTDVFETESSKMDSRLKNTLIGLVEKSS